MIQRARSTALFLALLVLTPVALHPAPALGASLDDEVLTLLPADALAVAVFSSLDEIDRQLLDPLRAVADEEDREDIEAIDLLPDDIQTLDDVIDRSRPLALVFSLRTEQGPPEPILTALIPVVEGADPEAMAMIAGLASAEVQGDYVALSADPNYRASGAVPALLKDLPEGQLVGRADLESIFTLMRPMVEMMISGMEQQAQQDPDAEAIPEPLVQFLRGLMDSGRVLEFAVDDEAGDLELLLGLDIFAGSVLDVGPQPPMADALRLGGLLPDWGELIMVQSLDLSLLYDNMPWLRNPEMMQWGDEMEQPYSKEAQHWLQVADELSQPLERSSVGTGRIRETGFEYLQVAGLEGAQAQLEKIDAHLKLLPEAELGIALTEAPSEDRGELQYHRYDWSFDAEQLTEMFEDEDEDTDEADTEEEAGSDAEDIAALDAFLKMMLPPLHLAAIEDRMLIALMPEGEELDAVLERFAASPKMPPMALEGLRNWGGEDVQVLAQVELRSLLQPIGRMASMLDPDDAFSIPDGEPVRIRYAVEAGQLRHAMRIQAKTGALLGFFEQLGELDD